MANELALDQIINNAQLVSTFQVGNMGGMRRSLKNNCLVIISDHTKGVYDDRWIDEVFMYTGMGLTGDQRLLSQNKVLADSLRLGIKIHLFEVHVKNHYRYRGLVTLHQKPFQEFQLDIKGLARKVWVFPLVLNSNLLPLPIPDSELIELQIHRYKSVQTLNHQELIKKAKYAAAIPSAILVSKKQFYRNPFVSEFTLRRAEGKCELCGVDAPFKNKLGKPHLEIHHVIWLSKGGEDSIENTVALCPNCHRKMHIITNDEDIAFLKKYLQKCGDIYEQ